MNRELVLLLQSVWMGVLLLIFYDILRIFRGVIPHRNSWITAQDLCYWILAGLYIFCKMYQENHGMIRLFVFAGILLGMLCYHYTISPFFVTIFVRLFKIPINYIKKGTKRLLFAIKRCKILICRPMGRYLHKRIGENKRLNKIENIKKQAKKDKITKSPRDD